MFNKKIIHFFIFVTFSSRQPVVVQSECLLHLCGSDQSSESDPVLHLQRGVRDCLECAGCRRNWALPDKATVTRNSDSAMYRNVNQTKISFFVFFFNWFTHPSRCFILTQRGHMHIYWISFLSIFLSGPLLLVSSQAWAEWQRSWVTWSLEGWWMQTVLSPSCWCQPCCSLEDWWVFYFHKPGRQSSHEHSRCFKWIQLPLNILTDG